ncbi:MAG: hypothetical protein M3416_00880 [Acidobacteriota bacterium]|nr:hypothetical protein [Acidobacteriota bacterium]
MAEKAAPELDRQTLRDALVEVLIANPHVLAVWEAGSAAFERLDEYSDLDIGVLAEANSNQQIWEDALGLFERLGGLLLRWHEPNPVFQGLDKNTFRFRRASRWLQLDLGIFTHPAKDLYNQPERHGRHRVLYDPHGMLEPPAWDKAAQLTALRKALHHEILRFGMYHDYFRKELFRGRNIDAFRMYTAFCVQPVAAVLGMLYRPTRWDFGLRYLHEDLPPEETARVERLCFLERPEDMEAGMREAVKIFWRTVERLAEKGIAPLDEEGVDIPPPGP